MKIDVLPLPEQTTLKYFPNVHSSVICMLSQNEVHTGFTSEEEGVEIPEIHSIPIKHPTVSLIETECVGQTIALAIRSLFNYNWIVARGRHCEDDK
ncbi:hypothetical protein CEXT_376131 [Caerostris extrusa]|uniref:Uncharacterized protein n=1 Tax=Caerostris extrusa TaxID=172846 RepID=A0AAV4V964_CAEEX|nr:hypothetical protein CEXT_376131 [Caerostris extrusa]